MNYGRSVAVAENGKIAVSDSAYCVRIADENGENISEFATSVTGDVVSSRPWGLAIGQDGSYFIADGNPYVKVFDARGTFLRKFSVQNPNGTVSTDNASQLQALAIDKCVYVGCTNHKYISIHNQDGTRVSGFEVKVHPYNIAITPEDHVIVSSHDDFAIYAYHSDGSQLFKFTAPSGGLSPSGLCIIQDEIFVGTYNSHEIYRYTFTGNLIASVATITQKVTSPLYAMTITEEGEKLLICNSNGVKVFRRK